MLPALVLHGGLRAGRDEQSLTSKLYSCSVISSPALRTKSSSLSSTGASHCSNPNSWLRDSTHSGRSTAARCVPLLKSKQLAAQHAQRVQHGGKAPAGAAQRQEAVQQCVRERNERTARGPWTATLEADA